MVFTQFASSQAAYTLDTAFTECKRSDTISLVKRNSCWQAVVTKYAVLKNIYLSIYFKGIDVYG
jgi:hypothetical protein